MKTKMKTVALLTGLSLIIASCGNKNEETKTEVNQTSTEAEIKTEAPSEEQTFSSAEFSEKLVNDKFFINDIADKTVIISDILVTQYNEGSDRVVWLGGLAFEAKTKKYYQYFSENDVANGYTYGASLNGEKLERIADEEKYKAEGGYLPGFMIHLVDGNQLHSLKIYGAKNGSSRTSDEKGWEIKDVIKVKGRVNVERGSIHVYEAEIIN